MVNKQKLIFLLLINFLMISCKYIDDTYKYKKITFKSGLDFDVVTTESKNGLILNNEYYYGGSHFIQKGDKFPDWLLESTYTIDLYNPILEDGSLSFDIWNIKPPFKLYKKSNSNILLLVKNNDTLQFVLDRN